MAGLAARLYDPRDAGTAGFRPLVGRVMTEPSPSPWIQSDEASRQRREERRLAAEKARERRRLYIVIALGILVLLAIVGLLWPH